MQYPKQLLRGTLPMKAAPYIQNKRDNYKL